MWPLKNYQSVFEHIKTNIVNSIRRNRERNMIQYKENIFFLKYNSPVKAYSDKSANRGGGGHSLKRINKSAHYSTVRKSSCDNLPEVERDTDQ